jgi:hypothetical protein
MRRRAILLLTIPASLPAWAQTTRQQSQPVFRCGSEGRELSDRPCGPAAQASSVAFDQPSKTDEMAARQRAAQDAKTADELATKRLHEAAKATPGPSRLDAPAKAPEPTQPAKKSKESKPTKPHKPEKKHKPKPVRQAHP